MRETLHQGHAHPEGAPPDVFITPALFDELGARFVRLLRGLTPEEWELPTVCAGWKVKDVASHVLDGMLRRLSAHRDRHRPARAADEFERAGSLPEFLRLLNHEWTRATDRLSPAMLCDLLEWAGPQLSTFFGTLDPDGEAFFPVSWAGEERSRNRLDVAREYTEQWNHARQIVEAVGRGHEIEGRRMYGPVLDVFARALPVAFWGVDAAEGVRVRLAVIGEAGGVWDVVRTGGAWASRRGSATPASGTLAVDASEAWLMLTKRWPRERKLQRCRSIRVEGDEALAARLLDAVAIVA